MTHYSQRPGKGKALGRMATTKREEDREILKNEKS